jgi:hypothetical protein
MFCIGARQTSLIHHATIVSIPRSHEHQTSIYRRVKEWVHFTCTLLELYTNKLCSCLRAPFASAKRTRKQPKYLQTDIQSGTVTHLDYAVDGHNRA